MKRNVLIIFLLLAAVCFVGCNKPIQESAATETPNINTGNQMGIYTIDSEDSEVMQVFVKYEKPLTLQAIVSLVTQNMDEKVNVVSCKREGKKAIVVFSNKGAPMKGCNAKVEGMILECFSNSILDNLKGCQSIIFRSETGPYRGEHFSFEINEVYATE